MKIKVICNCGTKFEFEVQPVNGRMPVTIACPVCNIDATELANAVIQQQLAAAPPAPVGIAAAPVMPSAPPPPPKPAPQSSLRINKPHAAAPAPVAAAATTTEAPVDSSAQMCAKHPGEPAVDSCVVCHKPVCPKCMEQFGHVCSVYCRQQATAQRIYVPVYAKQKSLVADKSNRKLKLISYAATLLVVAVLGFWFWYAWFGRDFKVVYSQSLPPYNPLLDKVRPPSEFYKLVAPNQLFSIKNKKATLLDITLKKELWSTALQSGSSSVAPVAKPSAAKNKTTDADADASETENDYAFSDAQVIATTNDLWLVFQDQVVRLDRQTGTRKDSLARSGYGGFSHDDNAMLVVSSDVGGAMTLSRISLPDGNVQTTNISSKSEQLKPAVKIPPTKTAARTNAVKIAVAPTNRKIDKIRAATAAVQGVQTIAQPDAAALADTSDEEDIGSFGFYGDGSRPFTLAGQSVVQFHTKLLEEKSVTRQAMKAKGKTVLDGNVTASQGLDLAQEMMNDSQRDLTGGVEVEDVSRYQVTLHRWFTQGVTDWTGEVIGRPKFYASKTVDVLVAGQSITVFSKDNKKLWEAKLTYPMQNSFGSAPFLETKDTLYFADPGILTSFDLANGSVRWRLNSVGITAIQTDERGKLYVNTTTAGPDKIKYSQQHDIHEKIHPVILKVDPATGKVLWRDEAVGDKCLLSGKFLYCTWVTHVQSALKLEEGPDTFFNFNLLDSGNGSTISNYHLTNHHIVETDVEKNWILLHFEDKVIVLKFFSL